MEAPGVAVSRLRRFIHGLATLAARSGPTAPPAEPKRSATGQLTHQGTPSSAHLGTPCSDPAADVLVESTSQLMSEGAETVDAERRPARPATVLDSRLEQGLSHIGRREWGRAQRALEEVVRSDPKCQAGAYLAEVRAVRRCLRQLNRWPRDAQMHLELGRLYFGLELGDEALAEFRQVVQLEPNMAEGHFYLALEYIFQGDDVAARSSCEQALQLKPDLLSYDDLRSMLTAAAEGPELIHQRAL